MLQWHHGICQYLGPHLRSLTRCRDPQESSRAILAAWAHHQPSTARTSNVSPSIPTLYSVPDAAMLASVSFALIPGFDTGSINRCVERAGSAAIWQVHVGCLLAGAQGPTRRHRPVGVRAEQPQKAFHEACGLPDRQTGRSVFRHVRIAAVLNCCCRPRLPTRTIPGLNRIDNAPRRLGLLLQAVIAGRPVRGCVFCGHLTTHASQLSHRMQTVSPSQHLCNKAHRNS